MRASLVPALLAATVHAAPADNGFSVTSSDNTKKTAGVMAKDLLSFINGSSPYLLPNDAGNYQGKASGNLWDTIFEYGHVTGDNQYRDNATAALLSQRGLHNDFLPDSSSLTEDSSPNMQSNWALAAMTAAERGVPNPKGSNEPRWIDLAKNTFDFQMRFFDEDAATDGKNGKTCGGGLRGAYLHDSSTTPYDWKPSDPDAALFNLAARLHRFTGNNTYADAATRVWNWMVKVGYLDTKAYNISSGSFASDNCEVGDPRHDQQWSRTNALFLLGAAHMYNGTSRGGSRSSTEWHDRVVGLVHYASKAFVKDSVVYEQWCEIFDACEEDYAYKGVFVRDYAQAAQVAPFIAEDVVPVLQSTAKAAVSKCTLGNNGPECGFFWAGPPEFGTKPEYSHTDDVNGNIQSTALSAVLAVLTGDAVAPYTAANSPNKGDDKAAPSPSDSNKDDSKGKDDKSSLAAVGRAQASVAVIVLVALLAV